MSTSPPLTQFIGQTERTLSALMTRVLTRTGGTFPQWVALTFAAAGDDGIARPELVARLTAALRVDDAAADAVIAELADEGLLQTPSAPVVALTDAGRERHASTRAAIDQITGPLFADIPAADEATTRRVLTTITERAATQLARG